MIAEKPIIHQANSKDKSIYALFNDFIIKQDHPCIMAQTMFKQKSADLHVYEHFGTTDTAAKILDDLRTYIEGYDFTTNDFNTFIAVFKGPSAMTEEQFEKVLWKQLQFLHELDNRPWDADVSPDPEHDNFSFSLLGHAFYIIGLHPNSSRKARQAPYPAMVFNLHSQFEKLREMGVYHQVRDSIREKDLQFQGSINPMIEDFGKRSEARQYSGREIDDTWKCPFHHG